MNRALLQSVLRMVGGEESTKDSTLLDAYRQRRDDGAFGQLVKRYARLVWHVCRNLTRCDADAEDAFQATFLVLARNAGKIARPERLGSWLHGVACRVCSKARREAGRRTKRERSVANGEASNGVTDSKWDRALAAVHEELAGMPEIYRLPFVLCCLEGRGTTEAASQLGWKLGTLSGRLTRAKDLLIARLESRGIAVGAVAFTVGTTNAPAAIVTSAASIASGINVPSSILYLSQGVIGMSFHRIKLLAAAIMLTGGLGMGLGTTWLANAQGPAKQRSAETELPTVVQALKSSKWDYRFDRKPVGYAPTTDRFKQTLMATEEDGWEFVGQINTAGATPDEPVLPTLVFRRKASRGHEISAHRMPFDLTTCTSCHAVSPNSSMVEQLTGDLEKKMAPQDLRASFTSALKSLDQKNAKITELEAQITRLKGQTKNEIKQVIQPADSPLNQLAQKMLDRQTADAEVQRIRKLEDELAQLKAKVAKAVKDEIQVVYKQKDLPLAADELQDILGRVGTKIGIKNLQIMVTANDGGTLQLVGPKDSVEWAKRLIHTLTGTTDPKSVRP